MFVGGYSETKYTDSNGIAIFNNVPDDSYYYNVSKDGYNTNSDIVTVSGSNVSEDVTLHMIT